jgi:hypothetical protein
MVFPESFVSGDRVVFELILPQSTTNDVFMSLRGLAELDIEGTANGQKLTIPITSAQSATLPPGDYFYQIYLVDSNSDRSTVDQGSMRVLVNLATITGNYDGRSELEQLLSLVNDAIKALTRDNVKEYQIKERRFIKQDLPELIKWRDKLKGELSRERQANGHGGSKMLNIRFQ